MILDCFVHSVEVEIHVCDEVKNMKKDFRCSQKLLVSKMGYFAEVTTGNNIFLGIKKYMYSCYCCIQILTACVVVIINLCIDSLSEFFFSSDFLYTPEEDNGKTIDT